MPRRYMHFFNANSASFVTASCLARTSYHRELGYTCAAPAALCILLALGAAAARAGGGLRHTLCNAIWCVRAPRPRPSGAARPHGGGFTRRVVRRAVRDDLLTCDARLLLFLRIFRAGSCSISSRRT